MIKKVDYKYINNKNKTLVLLHGWGMDKSSYDELVHFFYKEYSILTLDFFGFGNSEMPEDYYDTYEYAYQIFLLFKELNIDEVVMVGHSFGGRVAIILSSVFDVKIRGLVLASSAGLNRFSLIKKYKIWKYKLLKKLKLINTDNNKFGSDDYKKLDVKMKMVFVKVVNQDLAYLLPRIKCNTSLVWDKLDKITPYWICKKIQRLIKLSKIYLFKSGGHYACFLHINKFYRVCVEMLTK